MSPSVGLANGAPAVGGDLVRVEDEEARIQRRSGGGVPGGEVGLLPSFVLTPSTIR